MAQNVMNCGFLPRNAPLGNWEIGPFNPEKPVTENPNFRELFGTLAQRD
jgi:hypothetical protein